MARSHAAAPMMTPQATNDCLRVLRQEGLPPRVREAAQLCLASADSRTPVPYAAAYTLAKWHLSQTTQDRYGK